MLPHFSLTFLEQKAKTQEETANLLFQRIDQKTEILAQKEKELNELKQEYKEYVNLEKEVKETPPEKLVALYNKLLQQQAENRANLDRQIQQTKTKADMISKVKSNRMSQLIKSLNKNIEMPRFVMPKYYPRF